jgi:hypothetical protein
MIRRLAFAGCRDGRAIRRPDNRLRIAFDIDRGQARLTSP